MLKQKKINPYQKLILNLDKLKLGKTDMRDQVYRGVNTIAIGGLRYIKSANICTKKLTILTHAPFP